MDSRGVEVALQETEAGHLKYFSLRESHGWLLNVQDLAHIIPSHVSSLAT